MIKHKNIRNQSVIFYDDPPTDRGYQFYDGAFLPPFQFIFNQSKAIELKIYDATNDNLLGTEVISPVVDDLNDDGSNEFIYEFRLDRQNYPIPGSSDKIYLTLEIDNKLYYSSTFCTIKEPRYRLEWDNECNNLNGYYDGLFYNEFYFNALQAESDVETVEDVIKTRPQKEITQRVYQRNRYRIQFYGYREYKRTFEAIKLNDTVKLEDDAGDEYEIYDVEVEFGAEGNDYGVFTITYSIKDEPINVLACCEADFSVTDEDDDNGDPDPCDSASVTFNFNEPTLNAVTNGFPSGSNFTYEWYLIEGSGQTPLGGGQTITVNQYGIYRLVVNGGGCVKVAEFNYTDPCAGFGFAFTVNGTSIVANLYSGITGVTFNWKYVDEQNNETPLNDSNNEIVATNSGTYVLTITDGECTYTDSVQIDVTECNLSVSVVENNGVLTLIDDCEADRSVKWLLKEKEATGFLALGNTTDTQQINQNGVYQVKVFCGNCSASAYYLQNECEPECNINVEIEELGNMLNVVIDECDGMAEIIWYKNSGSGFMQIGTGQSIDKEGNGVYKVIVRCDGCEDTDDIMIIDCEECNVNVTVEQDGDTMNATVTGCDDTPTIQWFRDEGEGRIDINKSGTTINVSQPGVYIAVATCGDCEGEGGAVYCPDGSGGDLNVEYPAICS